MIKKHTLIRLSYLLLVVLGCAGLYAPTHAQTTLKSESFETDGETIRYVSTTFDLRPSATPAQYFLREDNPVIGPTGTQSFGTTAVPSTITNVTGSYFWAGEGFTGQGSILRPPQTVTLNSTTVTGYSGLQVKVAFADARGSGYSAATLQWENDDYVRVQYSMDGGAWITIGQFVGDNAAGGTAGNLRQDLNLNGTSYDNTSAPIVTQALTDYTFSIPGTGSSLQVRVQVEANGGTEELAFDNIRILGTISATQPPVLANIESSALSYSEGDPATLITNTLTVSDPDNTTLTGGSVSITTGFTPGQDVLSFTNQNGITGSYNSSTGVMTLSGTATLANYQAALRSVKYQNTETITATGGLRLINYSVTDGANTSNAQTRYINVAVVLNAPAALPYTESFETNGEGLRYNSNTWSALPATCLGFLRTNQNAYTCANNAVTGIDGSYYWYAEATSSGANPNTVDIGTLILAPVNASAHNNLHFVMRLGVNNLTQWENDDYLKIYYRVNSGSWVLFGSFFGAGTNIVGGELTRDADLNGVADAGGTTLGFAMQDIDFALPAAVTGASVDFMIEINSDGQEELSFDKIVVSGTAVSAPTVTTTAPASVQTASALLGGEVTANGGVAVTERGVVYLVGTGTPTVANTKVIIGSGNGVFSQNVSGLTPGTTYSVRAYAINSVGTSYGGVQQFTTPTIATVTTAAAGGITTSSAVLGGNVTADGGATVTGRGVVFSSSNNTPAIGGGGTTTAPNGSGTGTFSAAISSLAPGTLYYVRAYATNSVGTSYGGVQQFTTTAIATATAQSVTVNLDANGTATLNATSVNNGSTGAGTLTYTIQKIVYNKVDEGQTLVLTTPNGVNFTAIRFASYGTPIDNGNGNYRLGSCNAANSFTTAANSFVNHSTGSMTATNGSNVNNSPTLGDPCSGTTKSLAVQAAYSANAASLTYNCAEANQTQYVLLTVTDANNSTSTATAQVTVNPPPTASITNISPNPATPGATVTVSGSNLSGLTSASLNGTPVTVTNITASSFQFTVPGNATTGLLSVSLPCNQTLSPALTVNQLATVTTAPPASTTNNSSVLGGNVSADGGATVTGRGVVFSSSNNTPAIGGGGTTTAPNGSGTGTFSAAISSLAPGTLYYVRAYATNSVGTSYGAVQTFTTISTLTASITSSTNVSCFGGTNGSATVTASGGTGTYTYSWSPSGGSAATASNLSAGSYTVTVTSGTQSTTANVNITQPAALTGAISGSTAVCAGSTATLTITATGSGTLTGQLSDGTAFSGTAPTINVSVSPTSSTTYTIASLSNSSCAAPAANLTSSATVTVNSNGTWNGTVDGNWLTAGNWCGGVPTATTDVIIPGGRPNYPSLGGTGSARNVNVQSGASLSLESGSTFNLYGTLTNSGTLAISSSLNLNLGGTGNQSFLTAAAFTISSLTVNGGGIKTLNNNVTISSALNLTNGILDIGSNAVILPSVATITGASSTNYVRTSATGGRMRRLVNAGNSPVQFPVGNTTYNPVTLSNTGTADNYFVGVRNQVLAEGTTGSPVDPTSTYAINRTWDVSEVTSGGSNVTMTLQWNAGQENTPSFDYTHVYISHYTGSSYDQQYPLAILAPPAIGYPGAGPYTVTRTGITSFSPFVVASAGGAAPLPVTLTSIAASNAGARNQVEWTAANERNLAAYVVERSADGQAFSRMEEVAATGKGGYITYDNAPNNGLTYYRLKMMDADGSFTYSKTVQAFRSHSGEVAVQALPNPVQDVLTVRVYGAAGGDVLLTDVAGRVVATAKVENGQAAISTGALAAGSYFVKWTNGIATKTIKVSKQ